MSLIDQAAKRLEELRRAQMEPLSADETGTPQDDAPTPEALVRALRARNELPDSPVAAPRATTSTAELFRVAAAEAASDVAVEQPVHAPSPAPRVQRASRTVNINLDALRVRGYVTPDAPKTQVADEFRVIKRPIIRNAEGRGAAKLRNGNLVMVTSSVPGEGKTFTALNLAMSVAMEYDHTVLLVDGDVAHPSLPQLLGVPSSPGLLDLLTNDSLDIADALLKTNVEKLVLLPAGTPHRRSTELLASDQMTALLQELATRYEDRIIIFDSPPLLPTTEARVLATHMGQIVMVVAAESTSQNTLNQALATIETCEVVLMMLNKASQAAASTYGYYPDDARQ